MQKYVVTLCCREIRLIEGNAECRHLKKLTWDSGLWGRQLFTCLMPMEPDISLYLCLYGAGRNAFKADNIHFKGNWTGWTQFRTIYKSTAIWKVRKILLPVHKMWYESTHLIDASTCFWRKNTRTYCSKKKNRNEDLNFSTGNWIFILLCKNRAASCSLFATFKNLNTALELFSYMHVHNIL